VNRSVSLTSVQYAGFWRRFGAVLIDGLIFSVLLSLFLGPITGSIFSEVELFSFEDITRAATSFLVTVFLWVKFLGTPGKLLLECQVVDADTFEPMSIRQASLRYLAYLVSFLPFCLGFLWIARDKRKQGFHDKIANTVVLYKAGIEADDESSKSLEQLIGELR
jgi:uncharacterized RDD family membrane protein YckC